MGIYINLDISHSVTQEEWEKLKSKKHSFVNKILKTGIFIDEQK